MVVALLCTGPSSARGDGNPEVFVRAGDASCPAASLVRTELQRVLERHAVVVTPSAPAAISVTIGDRGDGYGVTVGRKTVTYHDQGHHCDERARQVAVFVALTLEPADDEVSVRASDTGCPAGALVRAELKRVLRRHVVVDTPSASTAIPVTVGDHGDVYGAAVCEQTISYHDRDQACNARARQLALFVARTLEPMEDGGAPRPPPCRATATVDQQPSAGNPRPPPFAQHAIPIDLEFASIAAFAPVGPFVTSGGGLRLAAGVWRWLSPTVGIGALSPWPGEWGPTPVSLSRVSMDLSLRAVLGRGRFNGLAELGLLVCLVISRGWDGAAALEGVDVGVRGAVGFRIRVTDRIALLVALNADAGQGDRLFDVGLKTDGSWAAYASAPRLWLGGTVAVAVRLW